MESPSEDDRTEGQVLYSGKRFLTWLWSSDGKPCLGASTWSCGLQALGHLEVWIMIEKSQNCAIMSA